MGVVRRSVSLTASLLVLALPGAALAQTPGDEQYTDPFGGGQEEGGGQGGQGGQEPEQTPAPSEPAAPEPAPAAPAPAPAAAPAATQSQAPSAQQLPRTGVDAGLLALSGTLQLAGGVALRLRVSAPAPRRRGRGARA